MQGVPSGDHGKWEKESKPRMFCEESPDRLNLEFFRNVSVHEFYPFKALGTLEQVGMNTTEWSNLI